ncbi:MAG: hypothetical protein HY525_20090 [Betaproteobacteria bacterium]|nr:hypothetical protein [Betaproteobacteria bacterium]
MQSLSHAAVTILKKTAHALRQPVEIDKVAVGRFPAFTPVVDSRLRRGERRVERLQMSARQPGRRTVGNIRKG